MKNEMNDLKQGEHRSLAVIRNGISALVLILIGGGLLVSNFLDVSFDYWWTLFLLVPIAVLSYQVWRDYESNGRLTSRGIGSLVGSLVLSTIFATFLFDLDWGQLWPLFLIFGGIAALLGIRSAE